MSAPIQIVDEQDRPVRAATKQEAWAQGLRHRIVRIMIVDGAGNVLLQHRSPTKDIYPNCWDNSAAGHVDVGEDYETAAARELEEEIGMHVPLDLMGTFADERTWNGLQMNTFVRVYTATIPGTTLPVTNEPDKIDDIRWFAIADVKRMIDEHPEQVTDGLKKAIDRFF